MNTFVPPATYAATTTKSYLSAYARALLLYAEQHPNFRQIFLAEMMGMPHRKRNNPSRLRSCNTLLPYCLIPTNTPAAIRRMKWLIQEVLWHNPQVSEAGNLLTLWSRAYQEHQPKAVVIGIIGLAIPPFTLGVLKKSHDDAMHVIVDTECLRYSKKKFAHLTLRTTTGLIADEIRKINGDLHRIEPTISDWLHSDQKTTFKKGTSEQIDMVCQELREEALPHFAVTENSQKLAVAIAPFVHEDFFVNTEPIE